MDKLKSDNAESEEKRQAELQSINSRRMERDSRSIKQLDDDAGFSKLERQILIHKIREL
ncbi:MULTISPECIES: hypothetical protein [unclassified Sporosarcina]|uniref:hypothetical protein n=1 Tax=unclassified Sporosarcina TaxID=2647733 RepID=UPI001A923E6B|nr:MULTISPECIES: hypothetical protein [unclassified Sporosarcina]MBO0588355.1 hypothetical protein [Sporosarcina sp. E16_8]MBO0603626.1 hypothetical protein [Sporosarcina sp. E16_3]